MKEMKRMISTLCLFMLIFMISACGTSNDNSNEDQVTETSSLEEIQSETAGESNEVHV